MRKHHMSTASKKKKEEFTDGCKGNRKKNEEKDWRVTLILISNCTLFDKLFFPQGSTRSSLRFTSVMVSFPPQPNEAMAMKNISTASLHFYQTFRCVHARVAKHPSLQNQGINPYLGGSSLHYRADTDCITRCFLAHTTTTNTSRLHIGKKYI